MKSAYKINDIDLYTSFGWVAGRDRLTSNSFLKPNEDAPVFSHDFGDAYGVEWDLSAPLVLKPRVFILDGSISGNSIADFWNKYNGFISLIRTGLLTIYVKELNQYFSAVRKSYTKAERLTPIRNGQKIVAYFTVELNEVLDSVLPVPEQPEGPGYNITPQQPIWIASDSKDTLELISFDYPDSLEISINGAVPVSYSSITVPDENLPKGYYRGRVSEGAGRNASPWALSPLFTKKTGPQEPTDPEGPLEPPSYDTTVDFASERTQSSGFITATITSADLGGKLSFNRKDCEGLPISIDLKLEGQLVAILDLPDDYTGDVFRFTKSDGTYKIFIIQEGEIEL